MFLSAADKLKFPNEQLQDKQSFSVLEKFFYVYSQRNYQNILFRCKLENIDTNLQNQLILE